MTDSKCSIQGSGAKWWYTKLGQFHRLDGPAIEYINGDKTWWVMGKRLTKEEFEQHPLVIFYRLCKSNV